MENMENLSFENQDVSKINEIKKDNNENIKSVKNKYSEDLSAKKESARSSLENLNAYDKLLLRNLNVPSEAKVQYVGKMKNGGDIAVYSTTDDFRDLTLSFVEPNGDLVKINKNTAAKYVADQGLTNPELKIKKLSNSPISLTTIFLSGSNKDGEEVNLAHFYSFGGSANFSKDDLKNNKTSDITTKASELKTAKEFMDENAKKTLEEDMLYLRNQKIK
ncbi:MAG: hypothetical protein ACK4NC_01065 [Candidatus Gracilibacteria bacterium]